MTGKSPLNLIGCLLDVSGSMRETLEGGWSESREADRQHAVFDAGLNLTRTGLPHNRLHLEKDTNSLIFVGIFGLNGEQGYPPSVDLCSIVDALVRLQQDNRTGHDRLVGLANCNNLSHITEYIRGKLSASTAAILHDYLQLHSERIPEFVEAIPTPSQLTATKAATRTIGGLAGAALGGTLGSLVPIAGTVAGATIGATLGGASATVADDKIVDSSEGLALARRIAGEWFHQFTDLIPRPVGDVVDLLHQFHGRSSTAGEILLDSIDEYLYGVTPMCHALKWSLKAFRAKSTVPQRLLVLISDGVSTDGDPRILARELQEEVTIAALYLTDEKHIPDRRLYDLVGKQWNKGQRALFEIASTLPVIRSPIPVLMSVGWEVPESGEVSLYTSVCSSAAVDEFCSLLVSERLGNTDALLDLIGRFGLDSFINEEHVSTCKKPSDQGEELTCYAHAIAAVVNMALLRIVRRADALPPSIETIRTRILEKFEPGPHGGPTEEVLKQACDWYDLRYNPVSEHGARKAVFRRRPVLATFRLSSKGWEAFSSHFTQRSTRDKILSTATMHSNRSISDGGGHAVVLYACNPQSLSFLNSWGSKWGNNGTFSIEKADTLEGNVLGEKTRMRFYDVFWYEHDLKPEDRQAYKEKAARDLNDSLAPCPAILQLEATCPHCQQNSFISHFTGSVYMATCPRCGQEFAPQPGYLMQALYARAGLGRVSEEPDRP
ncbi:hypothetical protein BDW72DRAFT_214824 [Aspergillus terricola var. indicus]